MIYALTVKTVLYCGTTTRRRTEAKPVIKQITVAECDICGYTEKAKSEMFRNEINHRLPEGWMMSEANRQFCICPRCWDKLTKEGKR
jgi:hypothetical protein